MRNFNNRPEALTMSPALQIALITSYSTRGVLGGTAVAPRGGTLDETLERCSAALSEISREGRAVHVDLYLAMEADLREMARILGVDTPAAPQTSITEVLGREFDPAVLKQVADAYLAKMGIGAKRSVASVTTFIPEISHVRSDEKDRATVLTMANVLHLAVLIARSQPQGLRNSRRLPVEIVAGSLIEGLRHRSDENNCAASLRSRSSAQAAVLECLRSALRHLKAHVPDDEIPYIALELEPAPYCILNDQKAVNSLLEAIEADDLLAGHVGFNIDLAHWRIAKVDYGKLSADFPNWEQRVFHAHISGHHPTAHFGDCLIRSDEWGPYLPELERLEKLARDPKRYPRFSGVVSIELEAIESPEKVTQFTGELARRMFPPAKRPSARTTTR